MAKTKPSDIIEGSDHKNHENPQEHQQSNTKVNSKVEKMLAAKLLSKQKKAERVKRSLAIITTARQKSQSRDMSDEIQKSDEYFANMIYTTRSKTRTNDNNDSVTIPTAAIKAAKLAQKNSISHNDDSEPNDNNNNDDDDENNSNHDANDDDDEEDNNSLKDQGDETLVEIDTIRY